MFHGISNKGPTFVLSAQFDNHIDSLDNPLYINYIKHDKEVNMNNLTKEVNTRSKEKLPFHIPTREEKARVKKASVMAMLSGIRKFAEEIKSGRQGDIAEAASHHGAVLETLTFNGRTSPPSDVNFIRAYVAIDQDGYTVGEKLGRVRLALFARNDEVQKTIRRHQSSKSPMNTQQAISQLIYDHVTRDPHDRHMNGYSSLVDQKFAGWSAIEA